MYQVRHHQKGENMTDTPTPEEEEAFKDLEAKQYKVTSDHRLMFAKEEIKYMKPDHVTEMLKHKYEEHDDLLTIAYMSGHHDGKKAAQVIDKSAAIRIATTLGWQPQKPWIGLTDEDWQQIADETDSVIWSGLKQAIETKLKEKNGGQQ